jgi:hypothetical protein
MDWKKIWEAVKEPLRWIVLFVASWIITQLVNQAVVIPESWEIKVWLFSFVVPLRYLIVTGLTLLGRFVDKYLHLSEPEGKAGGLLRF